MKLYRMTAFETLKGGHYFIYRFVYINNKGANIREKLQATRM